MFFHADTRELLAWLTGLERFEEDLPEMMQNVSDQVAELVVKKTRPDVPRVSGAAQRSLKVLDFTGGAAATGGSRAVPYFAWLNYGGAAGIRHSVHRPVVPQGRYLHPQFEHSQAQVERIMKDGMLELSRASGIA